jgi:hypothetical protein
MDFTLKMQEERQTCYAKSLYRTELETTNTMAMRTTTNTEQHDYHRHILRNERGAQGATRKTVGILVAVVSSIAESITIISALATGSTVLLIEGVASLAIMLAVSNAIYKSGKNAAQNQQASYPFIGAISTQSIQQVPVQRLPPPPPPPVNYGVPTQINYGYQRRP